MAREKINPLGKDVGVILLSIFVAIFAMKSGVLQSILSSTETYALSSFIAGIFFTSIFTTVPAIVVLGELATKDSILMTAFAGAFGALIGDMLIFRFVRDTLSEDLQRYLKKGHPHLKAIAHSRVYQRFLPLLGAIVIASPLPDELGLVMLGASHVSTQKFIMISYSFNFLGILVIGIVSRSFL